jgi:uncharacterized protein
MNNVQTKDTKLYMKTSFLSSSSHVISSGWARRPEYSQARTPALPMKAMACAGILALSLTLTARAEPEIKGSPAELLNYLQGLPKSVSIGGEAELRVPADQAVVTLKVTTDNKSLHEALRLNQEVRGKLITYLKSHNLPAERVHASKFSSTPRFGLFGEKAKSYKVENLVRITVEDEHEFQLAASTVDQFTEVQFVAADFEVKDKEAMKAKAVAQACDNANKRKSMIEEKLGVSLKAAGFSSAPVVQTMNSESARRYMGKAYGLDYYSSTPRATDQATIYGLKTEPMFRASDAGEDVSSFGELIYTANVTVEYKVEGR